MSPAVPAKNHRASAGCGKPETQALFLPGEMEDCMELKEQQYVLAIARYRNIKDAAQELCLTSSALSVYLSSLERQIGRASCRERV